MSRNLAIGNTVYIGNETPLKTVYNIHLYSGEYAGTAEQEIHKGKGDNDYVKYTFHPKAGIKLLPEELKGITLLLEDLNKRWTYL